MTPVRHEPIRYWLHAGLEHVDAKGRAALDRHLLACAACRAYAKELTALQSDMSRVMRARWPAPQPASGMDRAIESRLARHRIQRQVSARVGSLAATAAFVVLIAVLGWIFLITGPLSVAPSSQSASAPPASTDPANQVARAELTPLPGLAVFGDRIVLMGFDLANGPIVPGGAVSVTLRWQATGALDTAYAVFVHILNAESDVVSQSDTIPGLDTGLNTTGRLGETVVDHHWLGLPNDLAAGRYRLVAGVYDTGSGSRLSAGDGETIVPFATIDVQLTPAPPEPSPTPLPAPTHTPQAGSTIPSATFPPTLVDSPTPFPTFTPIPMEGSSTPPFTSTPAPMPADSPTPFPPFTSTPAPVPADSPTPFPPFTSTPAPMPADSPTPFPTFTPMP